jgi:hypothetical protein
MGRHLTRATLINSPQKKRCTEKERRSNMTFTDMEYAGRKHCGRRERFLDSMDGIIPWAAFIEAIEPFYPKSVVPGRHLDVAVDVLFAGVVQSGGRGAGREHI